MFHVDPDKRFAEDLTKQELYDHAVYHLGTMPEKCATKYGTCLYRSPDGQNSCAVGYFLKDNEIPRVYNSKGISDLVKDNIFPERLIPHIEMLSSFQAFHDLPANWYDNRNGLKHMLKDRGKYYNLDTSLIDHPEMAWNKKPSVMDRL